MARALKAHCASSSTHSQSHTKDKENERAESKTMQWMASEECLYMYICMWMCSVWVYVQEWMGKMHEIESEEFFQPEKKNIPFLFFIFNVIKCIWVKDILNFPSICIFYVCELFMQLLFWHVTWTCKWWMYLHTVKILYC